MAEIEYRCDEQIASITLNRDDKRNALSSAMADLLLEAIDQAEIDGARVIVLRANPGVKVWCAGHDLSELDPATIGRENKTLDVCRRILATPLPVIAMVEGSVYAGGLLLLLCADAVVATPHAQVAMTANKLGIPLSPDWSSLFIAVMGLHRAKELLYTATPMSAAAAHACGLYNQLVEAENLAAKTEEMARHMAACSPAAIALTKRQLNLLATQSALSNEERNSLQQQGEALLEHPETQRRIAALLSRLQG